MKLLVTGGAGFIGSNFVRHAIQRWPQTEITVLDKLTYAGNLANLAGLLELEGFLFIRGDICDAEVVTRAMAGCSAVLNFAAETHVDRSILDAGAFVRTDVEGTRVLLEAARQSGVERYIQISTDEVYGDIPAGNRADESYPLRPRSPYAASKAGGDLMVQAYHETYGLDTIVTRASNNFGPYQYPEKLIPLFVTNAIDHEPLPVYADGMQERDWLHVEDHCSALALVLEGGESGRVYNIATEIERPNMEVVQEILRLTETPPSAVRHVPDRPGHDRRYALSCANIHELGWWPSHRFDTALAATVEWYQNNPDWWRPLKSAEFQDYYHEQYADRLAELTR